MTGTYKTEKPLLDVDNPLATESVSAKVDGENQAGPDRTEHATLGQAVGGRSPAGLRDESSTSTGRRDIQEVFLIILKTLSKEYAFPLTRNFMRPGRASRGPASQASMWFPSVVSASTRLWDGLVHKNHNSQHARTLPLCTPYCWPICGISTGRIPGPTGKQSVRQLHSADLQGVPGSRKCSFWR